MKFIELKQDGSKILVNIYNIVHIQSGLRGSVLTLNIASNSIPISLNVDENYDIILKTINDLVLNKE